jgi:hypothetical protein
MKNLQTFEEFLNESLNEAVLKFANKLAKVKQGKYKKIGDIKNGELVFCGEELNRQTKGKFIARFKDLGGNEINLSPIYSESLGYDEDEYNSSIVTYDEAGGGFNVIEEKNLPK